MRLTACITDGKAVILCWPDAPFRPGTHIVLAYHPDLAAMAAEWENGGMESKEWVRCVREDRDTHVLQLEQVDGVWCLPKPYRGKYLCASES